jgi:hypothetical protein
MKQIITWWRLSAIRRAFLYDRATIDQYNADVDHHNAAQKPAGEAESADLDALALQVAGTLADEWHAQECGCARWPEACEQMSRNPVGVSNEYQIRDILRIMNQLGRLTSPAATDRLGTHVLWNNPRPGSGDKGCSC